jgi:hypothetical protein
MPRYYFHLFAGEDQLVVDDIGLELANDSMALEQCREAFRELFEAQEVDAEQLEADSVRIVDDLGRVVAVLTLRDLIGKGDRLHVVPLGIGLFGIAIPTSLLKDLSEVVTHGIRLLA